MNISTEMTTSACKKNTPSPNAEESNTRASIEEQEAAFQAER
jgi:hypothetical protein